MTEPTPDQAAISTAQALTEALTGMAGQLQAFNERQDAQERTQKAQARDGKRTRILVILAFVVAALDVLGTTVAVLALTISLHASGRAATADAQAAVSHRIAAAQHAEIVSGCQSNNTLKLKQAAVWTYVEHALQPKRTATPAQRAAGEKFLAGLEAQVKTAYAPRNCARAYKVP